MLAFVNHEKELFAEQDNVFRHNFLEIFVQ